MHLYESEPAYSPTELIDFTALAASIKAVATDEPLFIGIDGRSGGGKTTLALKLVATLGASLLSTDDFA